MSRRIHPKNIYRNDIHLPLFAWADRQDEAPPEPIQQPAWQVRAIARQTGLPAHRARLVAELAGFPTEDGEAGP